MNPTPIHTPTSTQNIQPPAGAPIQDQALFSEATDADIAASTIAGIESTVLLKAQEKAAQAMLELYGANTISETPPLPTSQPLTDIQTEQVEELLGQMDVFLDSMLREVMPAGATLSQTANRDASNQRLKTTLAQSGATLTEEEAKRSIQSIFSEISNESLMHIFMQLTMNNPNSKQEQAMLKARIEKQNTQHRLQVARNKESEAWDQIEEVIRKGEETIKMVKVISIIVQVASWIATIFTFGSSASAAVAASAATEVAKEAIRQQIQMALQEAIKEAVREEAKKAGKKLAKEQIQEIVKQVLKTKLKKMISQKTGQQIAQKTGQKITQQSAQKMMDKITSELMGQGTQKLVETAVREGSAEAGYKIGEEFAEQAVSKVWEEGGQKMIQRAGDEAVKELSKNLPQTVFQQMSEWTTRGAGAVAAAGKGSEAVMQYNIRQGDIENEESMLDIRKTRDSSNDSENMQRFMLDVINKMFTERSDALNKISQMLRQKHRVQQSISNVAVS